MSEPSLEEQRNQTLKDEAGMAFQAEPRQRVGGGKVHSMCRERQQPAWLGSEDPKEQVAGPASGAGLQGHRDLLWRTECAEWGTPGIVGTTRMPFREEWALLHPLQ